MVDKIVLYDTISQTYDAVCVGSDVFLVCDDYDSVSTAVNLLQ